MKILLIEDNPADARLIREAFLEGERRHHIDHVEDGVAGLQFLRKQELFRDAETPHVVLLDLNLPKKDGREVLLELKNDPDLRIIPVLVLTTSNNEQDVLAAYGLYANCYLTKPIDIDALFKLVRSVEDFWLRLVRLPQGGNLSRPGISSVNRGPLPQFPS